MGDTMVSVTAPPQRQPSKPETAAATSVPETRETAIVQAVVTGIRQAGGNGYAILAVLVIGAAMWLSHELLGDQAQARQLDALRDAQIDYMDVQEERAAWQADTDQRIAAKLGVTLSPQPDVGREVRKIRRSIDQ